MTRRSWIGANVLSPIGAKSGIRFIRQSVGVLTEVSYAVRAGRWNQLGAKLQP